MKLSLLLAMVAAALFMIVLASAVIAQDEPPPPYTGLKNPFSWSDTSVQRLGKEIYQRSCLSCHGVNGGNVAGADFSATDFTQSLEEKPDSYFWTLSEGRLAKGMPPYKSSLSEEQRWQTLTYLWSLGKVVTPPPTEPPAAVG